MRADDDVGSVGDRDGGDLLSDRARLLLDDLDGDALGRRPGVGDLRDGGDTVGVGPDDDRVALDADVADETATAATIAVMASPTAARKLRLFNMYMPSLLSTWGRCPG